MPDVREPFVVLLAEDDIDDEQLLIRGLKSCGLDLKVNVARDGAQALAALGLAGYKEDHKEPLPDLIISDLKMPKVSGDQVLRRVRMEKDLQEIPYVIFSSSDESSDIERCLSLGATDFCVKPVEFDRFQECVIGIVQRWLGSKSVGTAPPCLVDSSVGV